MNRKMKKIFWEMMRDHLKDLPFLYKPLIIFNIPLNYFFWKMTLSLMEIESRLKRHVQIDL